MATEALRAIGDMQALLKAVELDLTHGPLIGINVAGETPPQAAESLLAVLHFLQVRKEGASCLPTQAAKVELWLKTLQGAIGEDFPGVAPGDPQAILDRRRRKTKRLEKANERARTKNAQIRAQTEQMRQCIREHAKAEDAHLLGCLAEWQPESPAQ